MRKRTAKSLMNSTTDHSKKNKNKARVETQQEFSTKDILRSELEYRKDLDELIVKIGHSEKYKKNTVKKLARDLEEAYISTGREDEISKISARIKQDIRAASEKQGLDEQLISNQYITIVLEDFEKETGKKYKGKPHGPKGKKQNKEKSFLSSEQQSVNTTSNSTTTQSQQDQRPGPTDTDEPRKSPTSVKQELDFDKWVNSFYHFARNLTELLTGYNEDKIWKLDDNMRLVSETRQYRFDITKRLAPLDLKTIAGDIRKTLVLLSDFQKQIDDEFESMERNKQLRSE
jgi:hypothetical protein